MDPDDTKSVWKLVKHLSKQVSGNPIRYYKVVGYEDEYTSEEIKPGVF